MLPREKKGSFQVCHCSPLNFSFYEQSTREPKEGKMVDGELGENILTGEMGGDSERELRDG